MSQIVINKQNKELAFRLEQLINLDQFNHLQRKNYYSIILLNSNRAKLSVDFSEFLLKGNHIICLSPYQSFMLTSEECSRCYQAFKNYALPEGNLCLETIKST